MDKLDAALNAAAESNGVFAGAPTPDQLAMSFAAALMMTGKYESPEAAIGAAWAAVPEFYMARLHYAQHIAPMFFAPVLAPGEDDAEAMANTEAQNDRSHEHGG